MSSEMSRGGESLSRRRCHHQQLLCCMYRQLHVSAAAQQLKDTYNTPAQLAALARHLLDASTVEQPLSISSNSRWM